MFSHRLVMALVAALGAMMISVASADYTACGLSSPYNFKTWTHTFVANSPLLYPATETELRQIVKKVASVKGCRLRVAGTAGSADGLVHQKFENNVVVVNLGKMQAHANWDGVMNYAKERVRMGAGRTILEMLAVARPQGYILPTRSYGRFFSLGGFFMNPSTHGATFGADRAAKLVTAVRAMLSDGRIIEVTDPERIAVWRGSMGLLGIVVGIEIQLQRDEGLLHGYLEKAYAGSNWTIANINGFLHFSMFNNHAAHWFYNVYNDKLIALTVNNRGDPTFNASNTAAIYMQSKYLYPNVSFQGFPAYEPAELLALMSTMNISATNLLQVGAAIAGQSEQMLAGGWNYANARARDGFTEDLAKLLRFSSVESVIKCDSNCVDDGVIFSALSAARGILQQQIGHPNQFKPWYPNLAFSLRMFTVADDKGMLLESLTPGTYLAIELEDAKGIFPNGGFRAVFQRIERAWRALRPQPKAHVGKEYAFGVLDCMPDPMPFQDEAFIASLFPDGVSKRFKDEMKRYDPLQLFRAGSAVRLLGAAVPRFRYDPRSVVGESCESSSDCKGSCCCENYYVCSAAAMLNKCVPCDSPLL